MGGILRVSLISLNTAIMLDLIDVSSVKSFVGFKSEWATIKDENLYVGGIGKEWTTPSGEFEHSNPLWIKVISPRGEISSLNWISNYKRLRQALGIEFPGIQLPFNRIFVIANMENHLSISQVT